MLLERFAAGAGFSANGLDFIPEAVAAGDVEAGPARGRRSGVLAELNLVLSCAFR